MTAPPYTWLALGINHSSSVVGLWRLAENTAPVKAEILTATNYQLPSQLEGSLVGEPRNSNDVPGNVIYNALTNTYYQNHQFPIR